MIRRSVVVRIDCPTCGVRHYRTVTAHCGLCDFLLDTIDDASSKLRWLAVVSALLAIGMLAAYLVT